MSLAANAFEVGQVAGLAHQQAQLGALGGQGPRYMMAYKSGGACEEYLHKSFVSYQSFSFGETLHSFTGCGRLWSKSVSQHSFRTEQ